MKLLNQPIVENPIIHGFADHQNKRIDITVSAEAGGFVIIVADNGIRMEENILKKMKEDII